MLRRELEVLGELAELGLRMARAITDQATGEATTEPAVQGDLTLAFSRVSRAVRMAVLLQARLIQEIKDGGRKPAPREDEDRIPVQWEVQWVDEITGEPVPTKARDETPEETIRPDETRAERFESEHCERPERDDIYAAVTGRPRAEVIDRIREDLGLTSPVAEATAGGQPRA
jgi:hypothetical protein